MDMRVYYRRLKEKEAEIAEDPAVVVSLQTADGGKAGMLTEVSRRNAARLILDGRALPASEEDARRFRAEQRDKKEAADRIEAARHIEVRVIGEKQAENR